MKIAIFGATGLVGSTMIKVLQELPLENAEYMAVASPQSSGKQISFGSQFLKVITPEDALKEKPDLVLMSAGSGPSLEWAPRFEIQGSWVIDNSSAWRMNPEIALIVPEINGYDIELTNRRIIANPNCSTIQMLMALYPLHQKWGLDEIIVSTYQSVTGTGVKAVTQLEQERQGETPEVKAYPYPIDLNLIPHIDTFQENGYTKEEMKMIWETQKILHDETIKISPTAVRVPVMGGHSESIRVLFKQEVNINTAKELLKEFPGIQLKDDPFHNEYPMPKFVEGDNHVWVGRIRNDLFNSKALNLWVVADNLRKGAATNAIQIAHALIHKSLLT